MQLPFWTNRRRVIAWLASTLVPTGLSARTVGQEGVDSKTLPSHPLARDFAQARPGTEVDLQLALAVDASGSVSQARFELQRQGYADAFANRRVLQAIRSGPRGAIAVGMYQWTGPAMQIPVIPWTLVDGEASIDRLAREVSATRRALYGGGTSVSGAIDHGVYLFETSPFSGGRRVIDVSGDGSNNRGRPVVAARDEAIAAGININGLPILEVEPDLDEYFRASVIGGPGAFVVAAETFQDFGNAILRKLILEISGVSPADRHRQTA